MGHGLQQRLGVVGTALLFSTSQAKLKKYATNQMCAYSPFFIIIIIHIIST